MHSSFRFRPNLPDELHCVPCAVGMLFEGMLGVSYEMGELEEICRFEPGLEVWPFSWMLHAADRGLIVRSVDNFDPLKFVKNPREALLGEVGDQEIVDRIFRVSDVEGQRELVDLCLTAENITFERRVPSYEELASAVTVTSAALVNVNARILSGSEGYAGHVGLLHRKPDDVLRFEDPGPPPRVNLEVRASSFQAAWKSPSEEMANFILVTTR